MSKRITVGKYTGRKQSYNAIPGRFEIRYGGNRVTAKTWKELTGKSARNTSDFNSYSSKAKAQKAASILRKPQSKPNVKAKRQALGSLPNPLSDIKWIHYFREPGSRYKPKYIPKQGDFKDKPGHGLWASPIDAEHGWLVWAMWELPEWIGHGGFTFKLAKSAKIYIIDSLEDALRLPSKPSNGDHARTMVKWDQVAKEYDGVYMTRNGVLATKMNSHVDLYSWHCESITIFNPDLIKEVRQFKGFHPDHRATAAAIRQETDRFPY